MAPVIEMRNIRKVFPGVVANDNINLVVEQGEIHALLGENGAGKSTLMNVLYGLYQPDGGEIFVKGKKVSIDNPNVAIELGIGMVHQHFMLIPPFTVAENIILGTEPTKGLGRLDMSVARKRVIDISNRYGLKVDPDAKIEDISVGMQQRVEILKALYRGAEVLILDEPTAVLTPQEVEELIDIMRGLIGQGKSIIFITHKLKEVMAICDKITIIRRGKVIDTVDRDKTNPEELAQKMVGRDVVLTIEKKPPKVGQTVLSVKGLSAVNNRKLPALREIDLEVKAGEILGIAGVEGNGQSELVEVLTGLRKATKGTVELLGKPITNLSPRKIIEEGVACVPEDRHKRGLILDFSIAENLINGKHYRPPYARGININYKKVREDGEKLIKEFDVRTPSQDIPAKSLSGGNQQKVIIAREFTRDPELLIAAQPTRGLDVGAIEFVHRRLLEQRDKGKAVLLVSLELDEIMALSDRIAVMYEGRIVGLLHASEATEEKLGLLMAGQVDAVRGKEGA